MLETPLRKRVKTGCLSCRKRRRKCGEEKPECVNCRSKGLVCHYGTNLVFVTSKFQALSEPSAEQLPAPCPTGAITPIARSRPRSRANVVSNSDSRRGPDQPVLDPGMQETPAILSPANSFLQAGVGDAYLTNEWSYEPSCTPDRSSRAPDVRKDGNTRRKKYELELFTHYRYNIAPVLDLGLGSLSFGIETVLDSMAHETIYHAIIAVASFHRASMGLSLQQVDEATSTISAHLAQQSFDGCRFRDITKSGTLLLWRSLLSNPVQSWSSILPQILEQVHRGIEYVEHWHLLARLHLAATLVDRSIGWKIGLPAPPDATVDGREHRQLRQLCHALWLLEQSLIFAGHRTQTSNTQPSHDGQLWLALWKELQNWYASRSEDLRPVIELGDEEISQLQLRETLEFPCIVFSNACAVVANVAHHVNAVIMLQNKPRLIKPLAQPRSSISLLWHANRTIGAVSAAADAKIWDPLLIAALMYTAAQLSHSEQIGAVRTTMRRIQAISGVNLQNNADGNLNIEAHND